MKPFRWNADKNSTLLAERGICFEAIVVAIENGGLLDIVAHPNASRYPNQRILVVALDGYVHLVPFVPDTDHTFLKTIIPSRKATRDHLSSGADDAQT